MAQEMLGRFHQQHPGIRVFFTPDPEHYERGMLADLQGGTAADVFQGCCTHFPAWAALGYTLDLREYVAADVAAATRADWNSAQYRALFTRDGRQFGLPKYHGSLALYYNNDLFDAYGVPYPAADWTYEDYLAAMRALTHDRDGDGQTDLWGSYLDLSWDRIQMYVNGWGGHMVSPDDPRRCTLDEEPALAALEWLRARMWDDGVMATPLAVGNKRPYQALLDGQVAMVEEGSWVLKDVLSQVTFRLGVAPYPAGPARHVTLATTDGFGIYAGTRHPDEAWALLQFLASREYGRAMIRASLLQPARASLVQEWASVVRQQFPFESREMELGAFADGQINGYAVTAEIHHEMVQVQPLVYDAWDRIFALGREGVDLMREVCAEIRQRWPAAGGGDTVQRGGGRA
jgi:multiple sugar transport system substrate-binding protein